MQRTVIDNSLLEAMSAAMDGEVRTQQAGKLYGKVASDAELGDAWYRYHLVGDALRGQLPERIDPRLRGRTTATLLVEPTVFVPTRRIARLLKPAAGLAIAASVAALAIIGARQLLDVRAPVSAPRVVQRIPGNLERPPVALVRWEPQTQAAATRLNSYLVNYTEHRSNSAVPSMLPYVRIVGHEPEGNSQ